MTWIPISTPNFPAPELAEAGYMDDMLPYLPIGR